MVFWEFIWLALSVQASSALAVLSSRYARSKALALPALRKTLRRGVAASFPAAWTAPSAPSSRSAPRRSSSSAARGARIEDADGHNYIDYVMSWGPLIHGHAPKGLLKALAHAAAARHELRRADRARDAAGAARRDADAVDGARAVRQLRHRSGDERGAGRARGDQARQDRQVRRAAITATPTRSSCRPGSGAMTLGVPTSPGVPAAAAADTLLARYNDLDSVRSASSIAHRGHDRRDLRRADCRQHGAGPAARRLPRTGCATICDREGDPARLRRSDLRLPRGDGRGAADLRRPPGPDLPRQDHRRRPAGRRLWRPRRHHGARRAGGARLPGRHALGQPARDDGRDSGRSRSCRRGSTSTWRSSARSSPPASRTRRATPACRCRSTRSARC